MQTRTIYVSEIIQKYKSCKNKIKVSSRNIAILEFRIGLTDGEMHTKKQTGQKFGISSVRVGQIEAKINYEIDLIIKRDDRYKIA